MKKIVSMFCTMLLVLSLAGIAGATAYTFQPNPSDLADLDHYYYYSWGIDWTVPTGETIVEASLFFDNIRNWDSGYNDLWVHLLDSVAKGVTTGYDNQGGGDFFDGQGILLGHWEDLPATPQDITYDFKVEDTLGTLKDYIAYGNNFGFGFDPDCHFYNDGIKLTIETATAVVPEPTTLLLVGVGLLGLAGLGRKRIGKK